MAGKGRTIEEMMQPNHMDICWHDYTDTAGGPLVTEAKLPEKAAVVGRVGLMLLSCGTGAWRVRESMNSLAEQLGLTCTANIGLMSIDYTCFDGKKSFSQSLSLANTGVNTSKLNRLERFAHEFPGKWIRMSAAEIHTVLDEIEASGGLYSPALLGLASALACGAFAFLLGGGWSIVICAFLGAGAGNYLRSLLLKKHYTLFMCIAVSVGVACLIYVSAMRLGEWLFDISPEQEAGYICAMLFIIPGFPFVTSGIDLAKLDMRSGLERLAYAVIVVVVASLTAWVAAGILKLQPLDFSVQDLNTVLLFLLRLLASFCGVFGFSIMFNSSIPIALSAALIGMTANTLRLELVDLFACHPATAAFIGAMTAGVLASFLNRPLGYPRIAVTVPAVVIMVPGLYLYRAVYTLGEMALTDSVSWFASALMVIIMLPAGLVAARILTDRRFRHCT